MRAESNELARGASDRIPAMIGAITLATCCVNSCTICRDMLRANVYRPTPA